MLAMLHTMVIVSARSLLVPALSRHYGLRQWGNYLSVVGAMPITVEPHG